MNREPGWCERSEHDRPGVHSSRSRHVGKPTWGGGHGEVAVWLQSDGDGPTLLAVNVADGTSMTAEISLEDARWLRDNLDLLLGLATLRPRNERH